MATASVTTITKTPQGDARVHIHPAPDARGALVLGHGAGGGVEAPDLIAATGAARAHGFSVALVEQPYRVAGKKSSPRAPVLDEAWIAVVADLTGGDLAGLPMVVGGRSAGARVACRTAEATDAVAVLCLAFPLQPPAGAGKEPSPSRQPELDAVSVPMLIVQGENDRFGMPEPGPGREVAVVRGDHSLRSDRDAIADAVGRWLGALTPKRRAAGVR
jgi:predicted alpha/beta-hydrolase family hydrolase